MSFDSGYSDLEIRIQDRQDRGYLVELTLNKDRLLASGLLDPAFPLWEDGDSPEAVGERLFAWLFADEPLKLAWAEVSGVDMKCRVRLGIDSSAPELHTFPWELLRQPASTVSPALRLAADSSTPFSRYLALPSAPGQLIDANRLRILVAIADPVNLSDYGLTLIDRKKEFKALRKATAGLRVDLVLLKSPCTLGTLEAALRQGFHMLHFIGHGVYDDNGSGAMLYLANEDNRLQLVTAEELKAMFGSLVTNDSPLRSVFLASCQTATTSPADAFRGLAPQLLQAGLPSVLAMQDLVSVATASKFAQVFYHQICQHGLVDLASNEARASVLTNRLLGAQIPVLLMRLTDGRLFDVEDLQPIPECPYPGMRPFADDGKYKFCGREAEIDKLVRMLRLQRFVTVIGSSGSGKSSLVAAGLLPVLRDSRLFGSGDWIIHTMRPVAQPMARLRNTVGNLFEFDPLRRKTTSTDRILLVVDQFEETFTLAEDKEAKSFQQAVLELSELENVYIVLTVRADFYVNLLQSPLWPQIRDRLFPVRQLDRDGLREAIVQPAVAVGVTVEPEFVERILADAGDEPGILPFVQETLVLMWEKLERGKLTLSAYEGLVGSQAKAGQTGLTGLQVAMAQRADAVVAKLKDEQLAEARRIFMRLVQFGEGRPDTRRQQTEADLGSQDDAPIAFKETLEYLIQNRLLTAVERDDRRSADIVRGDQRFIDIAHEALFHGWPGLHHWIENYRNAEQTRRRLEEKVADWQRLGGQEGGLLDEIELREALRWLEGPDAKTLGYSTQLKDLIDVSREKIDEVEREKENARQRELDQERALVVEQKKRANEQATTAAKMRWRAIYLAVALGLAVATALGAVYFFTQANTASQKANDRTTIAEALLGVQSSFLAQAENRRLTDSMLDQQRERLEQGKKVLASDEAPKAILPDLTGVDYAIAKQQLDEACQPAPCFTQQEVQWNTDDMVPAGSVLRTDPQPGAERPWGAAVTITISQGAPLVIEDPVPMEFVAIPAGEFMMGSDTSVDTLANSDELIHMVSLNEYYIGRYEVTNSQYEACVKANKCHEPAYQGWVNGQAPSGMEDEPVLGILWFDAMNFTKWLNDEDESNRVFRLCTEAEWEKACRGPNGLIYPWGDKFDASKGNTDYVDPTKRVGEYSPVGDSPYGVADMSGNATEWVSDRYAQDYYMTSLAQNPQGPDTGDDSIFGDVRVMPGAGWVVNENSARCAHRDGAYATNRYAFSGLRACVSPGL